MISLYCLTHTLTSAAAARMVPPTAISRCIQQIQESVMVSVPMKSGQRAESAGVESSDVECSGVESAGRTGGGSAPLIDLAKGFPLSSVAT